MKVVFGGQIARPPVLEMLRRFEGIELVEVEEVQDVCPHVKGADVLVIANPRGGQGAKVAAALDDPGCTVRWVQVVSAGIDGLSAHALPSHIVFTNQGGSAAPAVAEHAMALLLSLGRRLDLAITSQARRQWNAEGIRSQTRGIEGSTLGVVGMGNIGREVALRARAFGATVHGFSRSGEANEAAHETHRLAELAERVGNLDAIVIALALVPQTNRLFDADLLARCKKGALLVNVARGEIVDPAALETALREGRLGGAATDVTAPEPLPADSPLWDTPNLVITPHIAATGNKLVGRRIAGVVQDNLRRFVAGQPLLNVVSP